MTTYPDFDSVLARLGGQEGGLIEIYAFESDVSAWAAVVEEIRGRGDLLSFKRAEVETVPVVSEDIFSDAGSGECVMTFTVSSQTWTTSFFSAEQIDFQGDPREVRTVAEVEAIYEFMTRIAAHTRRPVVLVPESLHPEKSRPYLRVG